MQYGNCYAASEALYHILGGKRKGWKAMRMHVGRPGWDDNHWFLKHESGLIIDPSVRQFKRKPRYERGVGCGFLTKKPSKRAKKLMRDLTWREGR